ncbi:HNH endonuclease [Pontibacter ummariensis]|uniref:HNH endonuclease n=1 Tax=Pontibacter ummariensis TaxID=1610492 RepID=A0A239F7U0_9BACT|nr:HNH endonuclease domain-containing protein [Pontibacter ummariensis]PRY12417.1 HNH endonuclease [Pontibacter ummariensis]SNS52134.1 HNH endonuclease [Pontibacter ummariensis]
MDAQTFSNISKIIERDSKFTTYKFALLRGTIDIVQENSPFILVRGNVVEIPLGLMIEKWILYYYPILASPQLVPQINGKDKKLAFGKHFDEIIKHYRHHGGLSLLYNELRNQGVSLEIRDKFLNLSKSLKRTIVEQPMRYIGGSISNKHYSIFNYQGTSKRITCKSLNTQWLVDSFGSFTIPFSYYEAFKVLGSFLGGTDSILFKWAEFSVSASRDALTTEKVIHEILKGPITKRDAKDSKDLYKSILGEKQQVECVWSGTNIVKYDVDHLIPFSVWKNNDLWNLLPASPKVNNQKRDKIASLTLLDKRKDTIIYYWELIQQKFNEKFFNELSISLTGYIDKQNWQNRAFEQLKKTSSSLINIRGYEEWNYTK